MMKESLQNIRDIIVKPSATFTRLKSEPKWLFALTLCCLVVIGVTWATAPFLGHVLSHDAGEGHNTNKAKINAAVISYAVLVVFALPAFHVVLSVLLTAAARIFKVNKAVKFRHIFASLIHVTLITILGFIVNAALLLVFKSGRDTHKSLYMMEMIPGLHHVVGFLENEKLIELLSIINLLTLWEIAVLSIAIRVFAEVDRTRALVFAAVIWLTPTIFLAGL